MRGGAGTTSLLPIGLRILDGSLVVIASAVPADVPVGAVIAMVNGEPAADLIAGELPFVSGSVQWREWRIANRIAACERGVIIQMTVETSPADSRQVSLACDEEEAVGEARPGPIAELAPDIWYVDLTRATGESLRSMLPVLARASGLVFDVRGYPTDAGHALLPHLMDEAEQDAWMHVAEISAPWGRVDDWQHLGWNLRPAAPHLPGRRVFLTDGRAISYAESVMGYVADHDLGTIVGSATAGSNGNVATFTVPGGFTIGFTGMRVTRHDGHTPHHLTGVQPHIPMQPTLAGLRQGRDELLEHALAIAQRAQ